ncbi:DNA polymerase nu-like [Pollicipes pollicipes]|uniref:DNA polymerase nu-like n=1 Tax=Pollicipes pollicipes TaxID=41117 RepID=UPI001884B924|nr:DNA polymerase nu-like [Pollicipes pollicipes]
MRPPLQPVFRGRRHRRVHKLKTAYVDGVLSQVILARAPFVARADHTLLAVDFCQMELRLLAHLAGDVRLIAAIRDAPGGDIFRQLAALWRERTKRVVYAAMYGAGRARLAEVLSCVPEQAQHVLDSFLARCPAIAGFSRGVVADCRRDGFVASLLGRRRWMAGIASTQPQAERQAVNFRVQGSAADVCKLVMLAVSRAAPDVPLLAQLHDELLWEVPRHRLDAFRALVGRELGRLETLLTAAGRPGPLLVPLPVAVTTGQCWADMQPLLEEGGRPVTEGDGAAV